jgi:REP element-mobilizing transposase RayT
MPNTLGHGHEALRRGRWSSPGAEYFLTLCTQDRRPGLTEPSVVSPVLIQAHQLTAEGHWHLRTATVMPDHLHLLFTLGDRAELSAVLRLLKGRLAPTFRATAMRWERGYFDHRLRPDEDRLAVFLYIYLNPYRAGLASPGKIWPAYFCSDDDWHWFEPLTNASCPLPAWLEQ